MQGRLWQAVPLEATGEARNLHEKICGGSTQLNRTCLYCEVQFPEGISDEYLVQHREECSQRPADAPSLKTMWKCPSCNARIPVSKQTQHEQACRGSAVANKCCLHCNAVFQTAKARIKHELICRGSNQANLTCKQYQKIFSTFGSRIVHEKACGR